MKYFIASALLLVFNCVALGQDLVITNARVIDGAGATIEQGTIVIADGRIVSVSDVIGKSTASLSIDAHGMTVMPGFIDTHAHILAGSRATSAENLAAWMSENLDTVLRQFLEAGVTTILSVGDFFPAILDVRERLGKAELLGPRLLVAGPVFTAPNSHPAVTACRGNPFCRESAAIEVDDPAVARAKVRKLSEAGVDFIKAVYHTSARTPDLADEVVGAIASEAENCGVPFVVHDPYFSGALKGAELGVDGFVHIPWYDIGDIDSARSNLAEADIPVATTVSIHDSFIDKQGNKRNVMGRKYPPAIDESRPLALQNLGLLWESGVSLAFGTDMQPTRPYAEAVRGEFTAIAEVLPLKDVIATLTRNAAEFLYIDEQIGTLEPGKIADIVIIDGDPLADVSALANVKVVIQGGRIVVDKR